MFCDYSVLVTLSKVGGMYFRALSTNGFHVKTKNDRFTATGSRCRQNLKDGTFRSSAGRLHQKIAGKTVPHVQYDC